jgi:hypothetical protein
MDTLVKRQLETRADAGRRIDRELRARDARPLLDDGRADAAFLQLARGQPTLERETLAVVLDGSQRLLINPGLGAGVKLALDLVQQQRQRGLVSIVVARWNTHRFFFIGRPRK